MGLKEKIQQDLAGALKNKEDAVCLALRMVLAAVLTREKEKRYKIFRQITDASEKELSEKSALTEDELIEVLGAEAKKRKESILEFKKGGRDDLVKKEEAELLTLQKYLPEQISLEELEKIVGEAVKITGAKEARDMGKVMAEVMPKIKGRADGEAVSRVAREAIARAE